MRFVKSAWIAVVLLVCLGVNRAPAGAANCAASFTIYNDGKHTVYSVYVIPTGSTLDLPDLLGNTVLKPGYHVRPLANVYGAHPGSVSQRQDIEIVYQDGHRAAFYAFDICRYDLRLRY